MLNPTPVGVAALLIFIGSVTWVVAPSYKIDWNEAIVPWWT